MYSLIVDATYIGFTDTAVEGTFEWVNGEPITYTNWAQGEPNNNLGDEHYTRMRLSDGQWNDVWIGPNDDYVVEFNNPIGFYLSSGNGSGGTFPLGVNTETWTVVDSAGNSSSCSFTVTVTDTEAPLAVCTDVTASLDNFGNAFLTTNDVENGLSLIHI